MKKNLSLVCVVASLQSGCNAESVLIGRFTTEAPSITEPSAYTVFQRTNETTGHIWITGSTTGTHNVEAQFNGGSWQQIRASASGAFTGVLTNQTIGFGTLNVRYSDATNMVTSVLNVGVGDVFGVAGQSNASGRGTSSQTYSGSTGGAHFGNDYLWHSLADPIDTYSSQVDTISSDSNAAGSVWPLVGNRFATNQTCPVAFVPCALGGSSITAWAQSGSYTNRASLYGSMVWRCKFANRGGVKAVLWWQGETDAIAAMSQGTYYSNLTNLTASISRDIGVLVMACKLQNSSGISDLSEAVINSAIEQAWSEDSNSEQGPDFSDLGSDDAYHLQTNGHLATAAERWWTAIKTAFY